MQTEGTLLQDAVAVDVLSFPERHNLATPSKSQNDNPAVPTIESLSGIHPGRIQQLYGMG